MENVIVTEASREYPSLGIGPEEYGIEWKDLARARVVSVTWGGTWKDIIQLEKGEVLETVVSEETIELSETSGARFTLDGRDILVTDLVSLGRALRRTHTDPDITAFVERDPFKLHSTPIIKGTRIPVKNVLATLVDCYDIGKIKEDYPDLSEEQVEGAVYFAVEMCDL